MNKIDPSGLASVIVVPAPSMGNVGSLGYAHMYIRFEQRPMKNPAFGYYRDKQGVEHNVAWTAGFYPTGPGALGTGVGSPGDIQCPDQGYDTSRKGFVSKRIDDWRFEEALAKVIARSQKRKPWWGVGYVCSTWVEDMWQQAKDMIGVQTMYPNPQHHPQKMPYLREYGPGSTRIPWRSDTG